MSYRVEYSPDVSKKYPSVKQSKQIPAKKVIICIVLFISVYIFARCGFMKYLLPGKPDVTSAALSVLVEQVVEGESVKNAVYSFCEEIISERFN